MSPVTGFSPYFLMFGRTLKLPLDIDLGIPMVEQEQISIKIMLRNYIPNCNGHTKKPRIIIRESQNAIKGTMIK